jgi:hypothetical protein
MARLPNEESQLQKRTKLKIAKHQVASPGGDPEFSEIVVSGQPQEIFCLEWESNCHYSFHAPRTLLNLVFWYTARF